MYVSHRHLFSNTPGLILPLLSVTSACNFHDATHSFERGFLYFICLLILPYITLIMVILSTLTFLLEISFDINKQCHIFMIFIVFLGLSVSIIIIAFIYICFITVIMAYDDILATFIPKIYVILFPL